MLPAEVAELREGGVAGLQAAPGLLRGARTGRAILTGKGLTPDDLTVLGHGGEPNDGGAAERSPEELAKGDATDFWHNGGTGGSVSAALLVIVLGLAWSLGLLRAKNRHQVGRSSIDAVVVLAVVRALNLRRPTSRPLARDRGPYP